MPIKINNIAKTHGGVCVFGRVSERTREGNDLYMEMKESGIINEQNIAESKVTLIYGQMNESPGTLMRVGLTALTMVEYFRDVNKQDVFFLSTISSASYKQDMTYQVHYLSRPFSYIHPPFPKKYIEKYFSLNKTQINNHSIGL